MQNVPTKKYHAKVQCIKVGNVGINVILFNESAFVVYYQGRRYFFSWWRGNLCQWLLLVLIFMRYHKICLKYYYLNMIFRKIMGCWVTTFFKSLILGRGNYSSLLLFRKNDVLRHERSGLIWRRTIETKLSVPGIELIWESYFKTPFNLKLCLSSLGYLNLRIVVYK